MVLDFATVAACLTDSADDELADIQDRLDADLDDALAAAFALMEATVLAGDSDAANQLAEKGAPLALDAEPGRGAQVWINSIELGDNDDS